MTVDDKFILGLQRKVMARSARVVNDFELIKTTPSITLLIQDIRHYLLCHPKNSDAHVNETHYYIVCSHPGQTSRDSQWFPTI